MDHIFAKRIPVTQKHLTLLKGPTITNQLPIVFSNGSVFSLLEAICSVCGKHIAQADLHGRITKPIDSVVVIEGVGICRTCSLLTPLKCRVRNDLSVEWLSAKGKWYREDDTGIYPLESFPSPKPISKGLGYSLALKLFLFLTLMIPMVIGLFRLSAIGR